MSGQHSKHRKTRVGSRRVATVCAFVPATALALAGVAAAADDAGQTAPCHDTTVCVPVNANVPVGIHSLVNLQHPRH